MSEVISAFCFKMLVRIAFWSSSDGEPKYSIGVAPVSSVLPEPMKVGAQVWEPLDPQVLSSVPKVLSSILEAFTSDVSQWLDIFMRKL